jgi:hypothetical protein
MAFNASGIRKQLLELSKLLQDRCIDVAFLSETHLRPHEKFICNYHVYRTVSQSIETTGFSVPIGNSEILLAAVYKPPSKPWCDEDTIHLANLRNKSVSAGDLNVKNPAWNSHTSNPSGDELLTQLINNDFQILAPTSLTPYPARKW